MINNDEIIDNAIKYQYEYTNELKKIYIYVKLQNKIINYNMAKLSIYDFNTIVLYIKTALGKINENLTNRIYNKTGYNPNMKYNQIIELEVDKIYNNINI